VINPISASTFKVKKGTIQVVSVSDILYADDSAFMAVSERRLQKMMNIADEVLSAIGRRSLSRKPRSWWYSPKELIECRLWMLVTRSSMWAAR
jgi:hypothetical protein